jgi:Amino acid synthesis
MNLRKLSLTKETIFADAGRLISQPITRAVAVAVVDNPFADRFVDDLSPLFADGAELGQRVMPDLASFLSRPTVAYGKAAIVGVAGEIEHGAAMIERDIARLHSSQIFRVPAVPAHLSCAAIIASPILMSRSPKSLATDDPLRQALQVTIGPWQEALPHAWGRVGIRRPARQQERA